MVDPNLELRGGERGGVVLLALLAFLPFVISSFFTQDKGEAQATFVDLPLITEKPSTKNVAAPLPLKAVPNNKKSKKTGLFELDVFLF